MHVRRVWRSARLTCCCGMDREQRTARQAGGTSRRHLVRLMEVGWQEDMRSQDLEAASWEVDWRVSGARTTCGQLGSKARSSRAKSTPCGLTSFVQQIEHH